MHFIFVDLCCVFYQRGRRRAGHDVQQRVVVLFVPCDVRHDHCGRVDHGRGLRAAVVQCDVAGRRYGHPVRMPVAERRDYVHRQGEHRQQITDGRLLR